MAKWIAMTLFALLACHMGDGLQCYTCGYGFCESPSITTCEFPQVCLTQTIKEGPLPLKKKSCSSPLNCVGSSQTSYKELTVTETPSCCFTDLCNSSSIPSASAVTAIAVLLSLWVARLF